MTVIPPVRSSGRRAPLGRMSRFIIGLAVFALLAGAVVAGAALRRSDSGPAGGTVRISGHSDTAVLTVPGAPQDDCAFSATVTTCTTTVPAGEGERVQVLAGTAKALPPSVRLLYWGCGEGAGVASCTITGSPRGVRVCVSTSDAKDEAARQRCASAIGAPEPESGAAATRKVTVVPVTPRGNPGPDYTVVDMDRSSSIYGSACTTAPGALLPDIVSCPPTSAGAGMCWIERERSGRLLCGSPWSKTLYRHKALDPYDTTLKQLVHAAEKPTGTAPLEETRPWALELADGTRCHRRLGGPAPVLPGQLSDAYGCGERGIVVEGPGTPLLDTRSPLWTVQLFAPLTPVSPDEPSASPGGLPEREGVAVVYHAGRPDPVR
ncbi:hypothetical protein [Streptomyces caniscabiei]|uniref:hypothetical protein n=1 Tax=Streptomyces caniscabiei TaxID=2746961 RepID=UPI000A389399|nr:hypothetical protein [Streptomyces caniscabiei]